MRLIPLLFALGACGCGAGASCGATELPANCPATMPADGDDCHGERGCRYPGGSCNEGTDAVCDGRHWRVTPWHHEPRDRH